ncbi:MAG: glycine oxidase ThiO [Bradymonadaceae bacterium]
MTANCQQDCDVAVIGAGVAGLGVAWRLAQGGAEVVVLERDRVGGGASRAAAGMLAPTAEVEFGETELLEFGRRSLERYPGFVDELEDTTGIDVDYRTEGTLVAATDRDDAEALDRIHRYHRELGLQVERLSAEAAREREPALAPGLSRALYCPTDHQVDPPRLVDALARAVESAGGEIRERTPVDAIDCDDGVRAVRTESRRMRADRVVVAAGAWTPKIGGVPEGILPRIRPVRGEILSIRATGSDPLCSHVVRAPDPTRPDVYLAPKSDGRVIVGATSEERGFESRPTAGGIYELLRGARRAVPGAYDAFLDDFWVGFRPVSLDGKPVLGPTEVEGLWVATGHGRHGILHTPSTADAVAESLLDDRIAPTLSGFTPSDRAR